MYFFKKNTFFLSLAFNLQPFAVRRSPIALSPDHLITYNLMTSKVFTFALSYGRCTLT